ncbi:MAG: hypothetical protein LPL00_01220 [Alphaproteobacteria bacterium]|nr:hypothetical protein [Alphaproteobacteria bacterium]MDX5368009.1 hypothetical protein [Alphaproteobacteria bacterium]MDX5462856.1 hypothetical protein [Alphaproteobacteria bacterium]
MADASVAHAEPAAATEERAAALKPLESLNPRAARIAEHVAARVAEVAVEDAPYQNFFLEDAFPEDIYAEMRRRMPPREAYLPLNIKRWKNAQGTSTRDRLRLSEGEIARIPDAEARAFWQDVTDALMSVTVQQAVYAKLAGDVARRLGCRPDEVADKQAWPTAMLVRDFAEYKLKPHPDGPPRVVTMMFYLADPGMPEDLGTSVYRRTSALQRLMGRRFEEVKRFPFRPNSAATFAVNDLPDRISLHGRELITGPEIVRDSLIVAWLSEDFPEFGAKHNDAY